MNESWVLPAISKLNGRPEVAQNGEIVYVFDDLQTTAGSSRGGKPPAILEEQEVPFSRADDGNLFLVGLLGVANLVGAAYLGGDGPKWKPRMRGSLSHHISMFVHYAFTH